MAEHGRVGTGMAGIAADAERVTALADGLDEVEIAGFNGPAQTAVAGKVADLDRIVVRAREQGVSATMLSVSHGFHSHAMADVVEPLRTELAEVPFYPVGRPVFSTVTGRALAGTTDLVELLVEQVTRPVRFAEAVGALARRCDVLVEAGAGTTLTDLARGVVPDVPVFSLDSGNPHRHALATAALAACGAGDLNAWFAERVTRPLDVDSAFDLLANPCESGLPDTSLDQEVPGEQDAPTGPVPEQASAPDGGTSLETVREHLSRTLELPASAIRGESTLLHDLHMNSLQVVQVVAGLADLLGTKPPGPELSVVDATVADIAESLAAQPAAEAQQPVGPPAGLADWVRAFEHRWIPADPVGAAPEPGEWIVDAPAGHWLHESALPGTGLAVWLADGDPDEVARVLALIARTRPRRLLLAHPGHPAAAAVGRSAAVELADCAVTVVECGTDGLDPRLVVGTGHQELRVTADGAERMTTHLHSPGPEAELPLAEGDVCLITGGADGITGLCGVALARRTGCTLVLVGRSAPEAPRVAEALDALGMPAHYVQADVTDPDDVARAVSTAGALGPVRGLLHGAGVNAPQRMDAVTPETLRRAVDPKVTGLHLLLDAAPELRLVVGFGSIIGRRGLPGQAEYCVANDWLRTELERTALPGRRHLHLEWSLWKGVGMGERMGVVDDLAAAGITPIDPQTGPEAMLRVLADRQAPGTILLTGRFPAAPTLTVEGHTPDPLRFTENLPVRVPGVEAVATASLSLGDDPYLDEHRVDDVPVLPTVLGLEAMAQVIDAVSVHTRSCWSFTDLHLHSPIVVGERGSRSIRVLALAEDAEGFRLALRDDSDDFDADRFTAAVPDAAAPPAPSVPSAEVAPSADLAPDETGPHPFYGSLLFHEGRFRRLVGYDSVTAFEVRARVRAEPERTWFSEFHHQRLLLGDCGAHDAAIHALLACVPHRRALPVGADRFTVWREPRGMLRVHAVERAHTADDYTFDVEVVDESGGAIARWEGLRLRAIAAAGRESSAGLPLVGPLLSRRLIELDVAQRVELVLLGADTFATDSADGRWDGWVAESGSGHVLLARAAHPVGLAWGSAVPVATDDEADQEAISRLTRKLDESVEVAATRIAAGRAALDRLGVDALTPLDLNEVTEDGLAVLSGAGAVVVVAGLRIAGPEEPIVAIAVRKGAHE